MNTKITFQPTAAALKNTSFEFSYANKPGEIRQVNGMALWLDEYSDGKTKTSLRYLQWMRSSKKVSPSPGQLDADRNAYYQDLACQLKHFKAALAPLDWQLLVEAPSSKPHAKQFANAAREVRNTPDILFQKRGDASATKGISVGQLTESLTFDSTLNLSTFDSVLIVDDVLAVGNTAASIIRKLQQAGLNPNAKITLAVALRVMPSPPSKKISLAEIKSLIA